MKYRPIVDVIRLVSAALIVCFHSRGAPYKDITLSGLAYFVLLTFYLQAISELRGRHLDLRKRASRLLVPWLLWSLFYGMLKLVKHPPILFDFQGHLSSFLIGTEIHLWFLPFAFLGGIAAHLLLRSALRLPARGALLFLSLVSVALATAVPMVSKSLYPPFSQWMYALPLLPISLAIALSEDRSLKRFAYYYVVILILTLFITWRCAEPSYLIGVLVLSVSILPKSRDLEGLKWLANLSMGIYLLHPVVFLVIYMYVPTAPWYVFTSVGLIGSAVASAVIMLFPRLSCLAFGLVHQPNFALWRMSAPDKLRLRSLGRNRVH